MQVYSAQSLARATEHLAFLGPRSATAAGGFALLASPSATSLSGNDGAEPDAAALRFAKLSHAQQALLLEMLLQLRRDEHEAGLQRRVNSPGFGIAQDGRVTLVEATLRHILVVEGPQQRRRLFVALARIHSRIAPAVGEDEEDDGDGASSVVDVEPSFAFALSTPRPRVQAATPDHAVSLTASLANPMPPQAPPLTPAAAAASAHSPSSPTAQSLLRLLALSRSPQQRQANAARTIRPATPLASPAPAPDVPLLPATLSASPLSASRFGLGDGFGHQLLVLRTAPLSPSYSLPAAAGARADATPAFLAAVSAAAAAHGRCNP
jgi:hypothetical protein